MTLLYLVHNLNFSKVRPAITLFTKKHYFVLNFDLRLSKNANLDLIVPGSGRGLTGLSSSLMTSSIPSGTSLAPPGTFNGVAMDNLRPSRNCLDILLAVRLCMYDCLLMGLSDLLYSTSAFKKSRLFLLDGCGERIHIY